MSEELHDHLRRVRRKAEENRKKISRRYRRDQKEDRKSARARQKKKDVIKKEGSRTEDLGYKTTSNEKKKADGNEEHKEGRRNS